MCATHLLAPAAHQNDTNQVSAPVSDSATEAQEKTFSTKGATTKKTLGHSRSWAIQREEREYQMSLLVSHKLEKPYLSRCGGTPTSHPLPYLTILSTPPLGELRPWLDTPLQDKAEQS